MLFNSWSYSILDLIPLNLIPIEILFHHCATERQNFRSYFIISYSLDLVHPPVYHDNIDFLKYLF